MNPMLQNILQGLQWDKTLAYALLTRCWQALSGPVTIIFLIGSLDLPEQGIYYAIIGIVGIQAYFELGLLNVLVSQSSHTAAAMDLALKTAAKQDQDPLQNEQWLVAASRMRDLIQSANRWFSSAALLYALIAIGFGWLTLSDSQTGWQKPLLAAIPAAAITVALAPSISILEGAGFRDLVYRFRLFQMLLGSITVWLALVFGLKLWALVFASLAQALVSGYVIFFAKRDFFRQYLNLGARDSSFKWMRDVVPVQWRIALISASFHFATQFFTIIVCKFHSDSEAAPLGMTLSISTAIQMVALAWVQTKYPLIAIHHGEGKRERAGTLWRHTALVSTVLLSLGFGTLILLISCLPLLGETLPDRFLKPGQVALLAIGGLANHIAAIQGFYVLAMKAKPLLAASLFGSIPTAVLVWIGGYYLSTNGVLVGYAVGMGLFLVPAHTWAYIQFRKNPERVSE